MWRTECNFCCCAVTQSGDNYQLLFKLQFASLGVRGGAAGGKINSVLSWNWRVFAKILVFIAQRKGGFQYCTDTTLALLQDALSTELQ